MGLSGLTEVKIINLGQSLVGVVKSSFSMDSSESESTMCRFLGVLSCVLDAILNECVHRPRSPPTTESNKGVCRAVETDRCTPGIRGRYTRAMKRKSDVTLLN